MLSCRFDLLAHVIGHLYRHRWRVGLYFRWLKHHFRTLRFFCQSRAAVYAQIAAAFLTHMLLVRIPEQNERVLWINRLAGPGRCRSKLVLDNYPPQEQEPLALNPVCIQAREGGLWPIGGCP